MISVTQLGPAAVEARTNDDKGVKNHRSQTLDQQLAEQRAALRLALMDLQHNYQTQLQALTSALDLGEKDSLDHLRRVTEYTTALSKKLGVKDEELETLRQGALLHDVGKLGISGEVLNKRSALSEEEWKQIRTHPKLGFKLLKSLKQLHKAVAAIVLHHHERFDGSGYPDGLIDREIPWGARIFAVVDALDAITSDLPYRPARSYAEARAEIQRHRGRQFDPKVVDAFMEIPDQIWQEIRLSASKM